MKRRNLWFATFVENFCSKLKLNDHNRKTHKENSKCSICPYEGSISNMARHRKTVHEVQDSFQCKSCGKSVKLKENLKIHEKNCEIVKEKEENKHTCIFCKKSFVRPSTLQAHLDTHNLKKTKEESSFTCEFCDKS